MVNLEEQIKIAEDALTKMREELKQNKKLELTTSAYRIWGDGNITENFNVSNYTSAGATRATKKLAEIASKNMVTRNRLEAYAMQIDPEWKDVIGQISYYIFTDDSQKFDFGSTTYTRQVGCVHMSKETAEIICKALNAGEIEL